MGQVIISGGAGGGVTSDEVTATANRVVKGYTYVGSDTDDEIGTGTLELTGTAVASNVESGTTFYNTDPLTKVTGSLPNISTGASITYTSDNSTPVVAGDNVFMASNSDGTSRLCIRYTGEKAVIQNNTLLGYPASNFGNATAAYVYTGKTFTSSSGIKLTGSMTVKSVLSFSVAAYSTSQLTFTWKNPAQASGHPFSGVIICCKTGSYPTSPTDGYKYMGSGSSSTASATSSVTLSGFTAGTTYYCRIWAYCICSAGNYTVNSTKVLVSSSYMSATGKPTANGRKAFTASGKWTVPAGVRSINIHCTGGGGAAGFPNSSDNYSGGGGGGGYTAYKKGIAVTPGQTIGVVVGAGSTNVGGDTGGCGGTSSASLNGTVLVEAAGGESGYARIKGYSPGAGGSGGGRGYTPGDTGGGKGGSNGGGGNNSNNTYTSDNGQGTSTYEFGDSTKTLYSGGGGGGGYSTSKPGGAGGSGGGGNGAYATGSKAPSRGSAGTGGGGGGCQCDDSASQKYSYGGSGNVIITW